MVLPPIHTPTDPTTLSGLNCLSTDGLSARDYANVAENWLIDEWLTKKGARLSGETLPLSRGQAARQLKNPPVHVSRDGGKSKGKGKKDKGKQGKGKGNKSKGKGK